MNKSAEVVNLKGRRKSYSINEKLKIISNIENCESYHSVAERTRVNRKSLSLSMAPKDKIQEVPKKKMVK
jgi:hypothetical protein